MHPMIYKDNNIINKQRKKDVGRNHGGLHGQHHFEVAGTRQHHPAESLQVFPLH